MFGSDIIMPTPNGLIQAPVEVRTKHRGVGTTAWNAPVTSKSEKAGPGSEILLVTLQRWGQISTSKLLLEML